MSSPNVTAHWWTGDFGDVQNLGDAISPILLEHFAGLNVTWAPADQADILCAGSLLDVLPRSGWHGTIVGTGQLHANTLTDLTFANVLGVRGSLTRERIVGRELQLPVLGDPGLLVSELVTPTPNLIEIGCVPHLTDFDLYPRELAKARQFGYADPTLIDITADPLTVITQIGSCRKIIASALHGVITADAFGIPRRAERFPEMQTNAIHQGNDFKWNDYASALGQPIAFSVMQRAPQVRVDEIQYELFSMLQTLRGTYA